MIYRFKSKLAIHDRIEAFPMGVPGTKKHPVPARPADYEEKYAVTRTVVPECRFLTAPHINENEFGVSLLINRGKEQESFPDIWSHHLNVFCSERFKTVLDAQDEMVHQYIPLYFLDESYQLIKKPQPYYWLNLRRFVRVEGDYPPYDGKNFFAKEHSENFLSRVQSDKKLQQLLESLPVWRANTGAVEDRVNGVHSVIYMNEMLVRACQQAQLQGMDVYSVPYGAGEESLVALQFAEASE